MGYGVGNTRNFAADPGFFYWPQVVLERRFGSVVRIGLNGGFRGSVGERTKFGYDRTGKTYQSARATSSTRTWSRPAPR